MMSTWLSWAKAAPGTMVELIRHPERATCKLVGHTLVWRTDTVACANCDRTFPAVARVILDDGVAFVRGELRP